MYIVLEHQSNEIKDFQLSCFFKSIFIECMKKWEYGTFSISKKEQTMKLVEEKKDQKMSMVRLGKNKKYM